MVNIEHPLQAPRNNITMAIRRAGHSARPGAEKSWSGDELTVAAELFRKVDDARFFAHAIVESIREPLLVLDGELNILLASGSFQRTFQVSTKNAHGKQVFALDGGAWDFPALRALLGPAMSRHDVVTGFRITHAFPWIGERTFLLHARKTPNEEAGGAIILLGFEDITERQIIEREKESLQKKTGELLQQKEMLLREMQHRVLNSLQIVASILMLKARAVASEEAREHLEAAHQRIMSVATVQQHLHSYGPDDLVETGPYLQKLCESLAQAMIAEGNPARLQVSSDEGTIRSGDAVNLGLIVTELVINALKYAFSDPNGPPVVTLRYEVGSTGWMLSVSDNGGGLKESTGSAGKAGLGTALVTALARQLEAEVRTASSPEGMDVSITHRAFIARPASVM